MAPARSPGDWANESFRPKQMGRMTWEQAPEWVQALGKHHSELLREAIVALKRDSVDFRQMLLSVGETRYDVDRERSINWSYNIQDHRNSRLCPSCRPPVTGRSTGPSSSST